jgi:hypothetical protein
MSKPSMPSRRPSSSLLAGVTALSLFTGWVNPAQAAGPPSGKASVLTLEGDDTARAQALSKALEAEFSARGVGGGRDMSLAELKLTMGCDEPPALACLSSGGKTLGLDSMIYGSLTKTKTGSFALKLSVMDVANSTVSQSVNTELSADAVSDANVRSTAKDIVTQVLGPEAKAAPEPEPEPVVEAPRDEKKKLVWGRHDAAKWKKAGLAASAALTLVSLGVAIGTYMVIRPGGKLKKDLVDAANRSPMDANPTNDINPYTNKDLCVEARTQVTGGVKNGEMTKICDKADALATTATAGFIATGIFAASTLVFTTLLFVHRDKPGVAKMQKHGLTLGAMPLRSGGVMVGGVVRF